MDEHKLDILIGKYLNEELSAKEREELMAKVNEKPEYEAYFKEMHLLWETVEEVEDDFEVDTDVAWEAFEEKLDSQEEKETPVISFRPLLMRVAAAVILLAVGSYLFWPFSEETVQTFVEHTSGVNETMEVNLPDGSMVLLNKRTTIAYTGDAEKRELKLNGEAFFEIATDSLRPFKIFANDTETTVLGTSFNIRAYPDEDEVEIVVESGKVKFNEVMEQASPVFLKKGDQAVFKIAKKKIEQKEVVDPNTVAWKTKEFVFQNTPFKKVKEVIERYYDIHIKLENNALNDCGISSNRKFENPSREEMIEILRLLIKSEEAEIYKDTVLYKGGICK